MIDLWKLTYRLDDVWRVEWYASEAQANTRVVDMRYKAKDVNIRWVSLDETSKQAILALLNSK